MALPELDKWVCRENVARFRKQLGEPCDEAHHRQLEEMLARELIKLQSMFPH
jgi:hypothetical protein